MGDDQEAFAAIIRVYVAFLWSASAPSISKALSCLYRSGHVMAGILFVLWGLQGAEASGSKDAKPAKSPEAKPSKAKENAEDASG